MERIKIATPEEVTECYNNLILGSFPSNEVKPLKSILRMQAEGQYFVLVVCEEAEKVAAAFVTGYPEGNSYLLDYLVVDKSQRSNGIGMRLIKAVAEKFVSGKSLLIETETLRSAISEEQIKQRNRRNAFYEKAGAVQSTIITNAFGAEYSIWKMNAGEIDIIQELRNIYHYMVPDDMYENNVQIPVKQIYVPNYYKDFKCIADKCRHTCCKGWEVEIDDESLEHFKAFPDIMDKVEHKEDYHFKLSKDEVCPFLREDGLCEMITKYGEDMLCQTCADHPRFRNFWTDRIELGLGLVCEEAGRIILSQKEPMHLVRIDADTNADFHAEKKEMPKLGNLYENLPDDEQWLISLRDEMLENIPESGPLARLHEYLIYRHIADALYDDRLEERIRFINSAMSQIEEAWNHTDRSLEQLIEICRIFSYDIEYDEDEKEKYLESY